MKTLVERLTEALQAACEQIVYLKPERYDDPENEREFNRGLDEKHALIAEAQLPQPLRYQAVVQDNMGLYLLGFESEEARQEHFNQQDGTFDDFIALDVQGEIKECYIPSLVEQCPQCGDDLEQGQMGLCTVCCRNPGGVK